jgi:hypothetical protein
MSPYICVCVCVCFFMSLLHAGLLLSVGSVKLYDQLSCNLIVNVLLFNVISSQSVLNV